MPSGLLTDEVRSFNRIGDPRVGVLDDHYLGRDRPLGQDRVLWEIGTEGCEVRALRSRLGLDAGHLSRLLRALEVTGLVVTEPSPADARIRVARLTTAGLRERAVLDECSDELAESILAPLGEAERNELVYAMRTVRRLLTTATIEIRPVDPDGADARSCVRAYFAELDRRSESGFDATAGNLGRAARGHPSGGPVPGRLPAGRAGWLRRGQAPSGRGVGDQADVGGGAGAWPRDRPPAPGRA